MIRIIFSKCDPSTKSGIKTLKTDLSSFRLGDHDKNLPDITDAIQFFCNQIIHCRVQDDDFMLKVFDVLGASDDEDVLSFVKKKRYLLEEDELDDDMEMLMSASTTI